MGVIGSSTAPPLDGSDTSLTPEQRKAYAEIGAALALHSANSVRYCPVYTHGCTRGCRGFQCRARDDQK